MKTPHCDKLREHCIGGGCRQSCHSSPRRRHSRATALPLGQYTHGRFHVYLKGTHWMRMVMEEVEELLGSTAAVGRAVWSTRVQ